MADRTILMVEGRDDEHVIKNICGKRGIPNLDVVREYCGVTNLLPAIPDQLEASKGQQHVIGIVIDADTKLDARWQSVREYFIHAGYEGVPDQPDLKGTILEPAEESPLARAGVWVMPNNQAVGNLEDFLKFLVPEADELFVHATNVVDSLPVQKFGNNDKAKAVMHTWLAWQSSPGRPYGVAIKAGFLDQEAPIVDVLVSWLNSLFFPEGRTP